jgi:hypothetical protein
MLKSFDADGVAFRPSFDAPIRAITNITDNLMLRCGALREEINLEPAGTYSLFRIEK